jgi:predicted GNAT family N-acyltransferase
MFQSNMPKFFDTSEFPLFSNYLAGHEERLRSGKPFQDKYFVMQDGYQLVACGGVDLKPDERRANLVWGMVDNAKHRQGLGETFLRFRLEMVQQFIPGGHIVLDTTQHSYGFFEKNGFVVKKITNDYYAPGMHRYDMISGANG